ncbi:unnamed protein product [Oikopleura dioica]|uniref:Uncharacterized protein n=1 Tax=Oikopleura dioica TaxID=34765 RepID=E4XZ39_OIKDI|nr:unnamed protein product [Oikopleura dioica]
MSDTEEERLVKILEESRLAIKDASSRLDQITEERAERKIKELKQKVKDLVGFELEETREEIKTAYERQKETYRKITKNLDDIEECEKDKKLRIPNYDSFDGDFVKEMRLAVKKDVVKWVELRKKEEEAVLDICGINLFERFSCKFSHNI